MRLSDLWRSSPLLWAVGVVVLTPLIVICGLLAVSATVAAAIWRIVLGAVQSPPREPAQVVELETTSLAELPEPVLRAA